MTLHREIRLNGERLLADPSGALVWPERRLLAVADLHFEKGTAFAERGRLLPPYDTAATLRALSDAMERHRPDTVICLGDSFHDQGAGERLDPGDGQVLATLTQGRDWIWVAGNHDPLPPEAWGGRVESEVALGALTFRHEAENAALVAGEVSGHFHPKAAVRLRARRLTARCFVTDGRRLILPAFGAYTGGLDVLDPAIAGLFRKGFAIHLLGAGGVWRFPKKALSPFAG
ncbi:MAG: ligase-associated DNA damage response endonuclease PdeM [Pseudomonadota bacterium]